MEQHELLSTKKIQVALKEAGLQESDLTDRTILDIKTFKTKINTVNMQLAKNKTPQVALKECKILEDSIIDSIAEISNDLEEQGEEIETPITQPTEVPSETVVEKPIEQPKPQAQQQVNRVQNKHERGGSGLRFWEDWF